MPLFLVKSPIEEIEAEAIVREADETGGKTTIRRVFTGPFRYIITATSKDGNNRSALWEALEAAAAKKCASVVLPLFQGTGSVRCRLDAAEDTISAFLQENEISRTHYLPNGIYGRDFSIGKATSINQLIYDNPVLSRNYGLVNLMREVLRDNKKAIEDRKNLDNLLMKASSSCLYFPDEYDSPSIRKAINRFACEIEAFLARMDASPIPEETDIDFDRTEEYPIIGKTNIAYLNRRGAVLSRFVVSQDLTDLALHRGEGLFSDSFINERGKETKLFEKNYEVTALEKKRSDFFATIPLTLGKVQVEVNKRFKFRQNTVVVENEIENLSPEKLTDYTYVNTINLALPKSLNVTCPEGEIADTQSAFTQSVMIQEKGCPLSVSIVLGEEATIQRTDFYSKARSWLGDRTYYEYTQLKIQKKLSLEPFEDTRLTIGFRTEKRKEKHNDTTEQSTS